MEKIKSLLGQMKCSPEFQKQFVSLLEEWKKGIEEGAERTFKARLEKAKAIVLDEVEKEKTELRRKVEIFLESRVNTIDREARKQAANGETEAVRRLREINSLLEGSKDGGTSEDNQAALAENNKKLRVMVGQLTEEKEQLIAQTKRAHELATKAIQRNRILESKLGGEPIKQVAESKGLESVRTASEDPKTSRPILTESQVPARQQEREESGHPEVMAIAEKLDGEPAFV